MLMNLKSNYARRRDLITLGDVLHMRWFLPGVSLDEGRELVRILGVNGRFRAGNEVLDALFDAHPEASSVLDEERRRLLLRMN